MTSSRSFGRRLLLTSSALSLVAVGFSPGLAIAGPSQAVTIDIATINDFHGRITASGQAAGAVTLSCAVNEMREANPNSIFVSAGDNIGATIFESSVAKDQPTIDVLNKMGLQVSALGNHEFDKGDADVDNRILKAANWSYVASNIFRDGKPAYKQYQIVDTGGVKVAFIGAITEDLPQLAGISKNLRIADMTDSVNAVVDRLSDGSTANDEADVFIVLAHEGAPSSDLTTLGSTPYAKLLKQVNPRVSAIVSGHTHRLYAQQVDGRWVTQSAQYGEQLGRLQLQWDPGTRKATVTRSENQDLVDAQGVSTCKQGSPEIKAIVDQAVKDASSLGAAPIGSISGDLLRSDKGNSRSTESTIGNFIADVQLWAANERGGADLAVINAGGIRTDLTFRQSGDEGDGVVTFREASAVQPFANTIMTTELTGAQLKTLFEQQWQPADSSRPFLKLGTSKNVWYIFDPNGPAGNRISQLKVNGKPVKDTDVYKVAANSFLMQGGDGYNAFTEGRNKADTGWVDLDAMVEYFRQVSPVSAKSPVGPDLVQRSVGLHFVTDPSKAYRGGDEVAFDLFGLSFTNNEKKPTKAIVKVDGVEVGSFPVDNTFVEALPVGDGPVRIYDTTGRASARFKLPAGVSKDSRITVSDDLNGQLAVLDLDLSGQYPPPTPTPTPTPTLTPTPTPTPSVEPTLRPTPDPDDPGERPLPGTGSSDAGSAVAIVAVMTLIGAVLRRMAIRR